MTATLFSGLGKPINKIRKPTTAAERHKEREEKRKKRQEKLMEKEKQRKKKTEEKKEQEEESQLSVHDKNLIERWTKMQKVNVLFNIYLFCF